jgi:hypothetical protein
VTRVAALETETSQSDSQLKSSCERKNFHGHWLDDDENDLKKMGFRDWRKIPMDRDNSMDYRASGERYPWILVTIKKRVQHMHRRQLLQTRISGIPVSR